MLIQPRHIVVRWLAVGLIALGAAKVIVEYRAAHGAELRDWRAASRQCGEEVAQRLHCASCSAAWPQISRCVMSRVSPDVPGWVVEACIASVGSRTQNENGAFDRIGPVLACSTRQPVH